MHSRRAIFVLIGAALVLLSVPGPASALFLNVYGGPTYDQTTQSGYQSTSYSPYPPGSTAGEGVAVGSATKYAGGISIGARGIRWEAGGFVELGSLGTSNSGVTTSSAYAVNGSGVTVGYADKYIGGTYVGGRAVRWGGAGVTELGNLGTDVNGFASGRAYAVNTAGTAVGYTEKYVGAVGFGERAVRWDASDNVTELGTLTPRTDGESYCEATDINTTGTAVGWSATYSGFDRIGTNAVRWDAAGTVATQLGGLGTSAQSHAISVAVAINNSGTVVGYAEKYNVFHTYLGYRAVRWDPSGTAAIELGNIGTRSGDGYTFDEAFAINPAGTVVGDSQRWNGNTDLGRRAVRWDALGTSATELGNLRTNSSGFTKSYAYAINGGGTIVGFAETWSGNTDLGRHAMLWKLDGAAIDLNTLIDPNSGWTLTEADAISGTNWVSGLGNFDPDGPGPLAAYQRSYLLDASSIAVPEPSTFALAALGVVALLAAQRRALGPFEPAFSENRVVGL